MIKNNKNQEILDAVRAAAHAWFEHGSSSSYRAICTLDASPSSTTNSSQPLLPASTHNYNKKPSRFKLEAAATNKKGTNSINFPVCGQVHKMHRSHLLDEYEFERIVQDLDEYDSFSTLGGRRIRRSEAAGKDHKETKIDRSDEKKQALALVVKKDISRSGRWAIRGLMCSTYVNDVVVGTRSRMPKHH